LSWHFRSLVVIGKRLAASGLDGMGKARRVASEKALEPFPAKLAHNICIVFLSLKSL
jgi:hypothetical protein